MTLKQILITALIAASASAAVSIGLYAALNTQTSSEPAASKDFNNRLLKLEQQITSLNDSKQTAKGTSQSKKQVSFKPTNTLALERVNAIEKYKEAKNEEEVDRIKAEFKAQIQRRQQPKYIEQRLIEKGFTVDEAARITKLESQSALANIEDRYRRLKAQYENGNQNENANNTLREQLGDADYERYLNARGAPTSVPINQIISGSAADIAGLEPGDKLRSYAGERVFNSRELATLMVTGQEGENVLLEVERNGDLIHLTIPRGPIGIRQR